MNKVREFENDVEYLDEVSRWMLARAALVSASRELRDAMAEVDVGEEGRRRRQSARQE
jgi:hypothetical protein